MRPSTTTPRPFSEIELAVNVPSAPLRTSMPMVALLICFENRTSHEGRGSKPRVRESWWEHLAALSTHPEVELQAGRAWWPACMVAPGCWLGWGLRCAIRGGALLARGCAHKFGAHASRLLVCYNHNRLHHGEVWSGICHKYLVSVPVGTFGCTHWFVLSGRGIVSFACSNPLGKTIFSR